MTDTTIENMLFHAPSPAAPPELLRRLQAAIALQPAESETATQRVRGNPQRHWFPTLAFTLFLLSCAIMFAVQANRTATMKQENEGLRAAAASLPQLREQHVVWEKGIVQKEELDGLRKDNEELHQLQAEVARLRSLSGQVRRLQAENRQLATAPTPSNPAASSSFFDEAEQRAERIQCVNNLKQIGLAVRIWAGDNNEKYSTSLVAMSNELSTVKILVCPSDKARQSYSALSFSEFLDNMTSYQYIAQPGDESHPDCIIAKCPIHNNYLFADGSVQQINPAKVREVEKDGRWYLEPISPGSNQ